MSEKDKNKTEVIHSRIWEEEAEPDNPFAAAACYCHGYDVYGDLLGKASWTEYLYLLFMGERPSPAQARLLEGLAVALANPGPRDHSVRGAMNASVGSATNTASLLAALAVGSGNLQGSREIIVAMEYWHACGHKLTKWQEYLQHPHEEERIDVWKPIEHPPGFDPHGVSCSTPVQQVLQYFSEVSVGNSLPWLLEHRVELETISGCPLAMSGVVAAAFVDIGLNVEQAEMLYLILRLPGAAVHALEQRSYGMAKYPFFRDGLELLSCTEASNGE
ncbi:MAG: citryl-CoA lyase [Candidatus Parabeggiatoa sp. nov. 1]|nr:MAG: citryl-CoA lyase [Gammaproteobacteria bacterium]